jgi:hypothetical protein
MRRPSWDYGLEEMPVGVAIAEWVVGGIADWLVAQYPGILFGAFLTVGAAWVWSFFL